jgi:hypothetical protein
MSAAMTHPVTLLTMVTHAVMSRTRGRRGTGSLYDDVVDEVVTDPAEYTEKAEPVLLRLLLIAAVVLPPPAPPPPGKGRTAAEAAGALKLRVLRSLLVQLDFFSRLLPPPPCSVVDVGLLAREAARLL